MSNTTQKAKLFDHLQLLANEIGTSKEAAARQKAAEAPTPSDPGGYQGATTHPTKNEDNRGQNATEGARSSENVSDVNADQGEPGVNKAKDAKPGQQDDVQVNIGTDQSATGEDPSVEDDYKGGKEDPGSSHPARTDNDSLDGHKYANATGAELRQLHSSIANDILADIATGQGKNLTKAALAEAAGSLNASATGENQPAQPKIQNSESGTDAPVASTAKEAAENTDEGKNKEAEGKDGLDADSLAKAAEAAKNTGTADDIQAGYELAAALGVDKEAALAHNQAHLETAYQDALTDANMFASYYKDFQKQAMEGADINDGEDHSQGGDDTSGAGEAEGTGGESVGGGGESEPSGGDPTGGLGGGSLGDALGGGGDPAGLAGEDPLGGASQEEALMQLIAALGELGIPLEELMGAGGGGEMGGELGGAPAGPDAGMPPGMEGGAPVDPAAGGMTEGMKLASACKAFMRQGKYQHKAANEGTPERKLRNYMKNHIIELMNSK